MVDSECLLSFDLGTRRIWMFPRNIRQIWPWKLYQTMNVLMQFNGKENIRDKDIQQHMYELLEGLGVKGKGDTRDANPGGMRTYFAQLACLGLVYTKKDHSYGLTLAGQQLIDGKNPVKVVQYSLFRHQYPSAYGSRIKMDPRMRVKPFLFLLKLLHDPEIQGYLTNKDVMIPVVYGHTDACYNFCKQKILELRAKPAESGMDDVLSILDNPVADLYTPRGASDLPHQLGNVKDIANTALNYLVSSYLIIENDEKVRGQKSYAFNPEYEDLYQLFQQERGKYVPCLAKKEEAFQRSYGRYDKYKDGRNDDEKRSVSRGEDTIIKVKFVDFMYQHPFEEFEGALVSDFVSSLGKLGVRSNTDVLSVVAPLLEEKSSLDESKYLEYSISGVRYCNEFEQATTALLKSMGFDTSEWIGRRQAKQTWRGNFPDILIREGTDLQIGFADTKASNSYMLGHDDMLKCRETYAHTNNELVPGSSIKYFLYIAGGFKGNINASIKQLSEATGFPVTAMTARAMLALRKKKEQEHLPTKFIEKTIFRSGTMWNATGLQQI